MNVNNSSHLQQTTTHWHALMTEQLARATSFCDEAAKRFDQGIAQARSLTEESTKVLVAWLEYGAALEKEWQRVSLEGAKKSLEFLAPRG
jgi:hypothetical protein